MSTLSADGVVFFDPLPEPWHRNRAAGWALVCSIFLHALAIAFLPGLRTPKPQPRVLTVQLAQQPAQRSATAPQPAEKPAAAAKAAPAPQPAAPAPRAAPKPEQKKQLVKPTQQKPFERQALQPAPLVAQAPPPSQVEPRPRLAPAPSAEPNIAPAPETQAAPTITPADPRPL